MLRDVSVGSAKWVLLGGDDEKQRSAAANVDDGIETPFLQLVLERLWADSAGNGSRVLRLDTYLELDRAPGIVRRHFEEVLSAMSPEQRELCARFFDRLVTPSGGKIAYPIADLEQVAGELAPYVPATIKALRDGRILQEVQLPDYRGVEIFHDVLGPAVLEWQRRLDEQRRRAEARRLRARRMLRAALIAGTAVALALAFLGYLVYDGWREQRPWAAVTDLRTGDVYGLSGKQATVGRASIGYDNTVDFANVPNPVSRLHLLVLPDGRASDLRSLYGTTINGVFLKYGDPPRALERGDIVVLAGIVPLRYEPVGYSRLQFWTPELSGKSVPGWAVLVDGAARAVHPIRRPGSTSTSGAAGRRRPRARPRLDRAGGSGRAGRVRAGPRRRPTADGHDQGGRLRVSAAEAERRRRPLPRQRAVLVRQPGVLDTRRPVPGRRAPVLSERVPLRRASRGPARQPRRPSELCPAPGTR